MVCIPRQRRDIQTRYVLTHSICLLRKRGIYLISIRGFAKYISKVKETASMTDSGADVLHIASYDAHKEAAVNEAFAPALDMTTSLRANKSFSSC